ncbi:MAG: S1C family serine protease [Thermomonas sp.]|uniref:S1C family serine protease n=1 Tax=Thermomonas sp. TaxID=1971895 RepID=UPI001EB596CA|nr:S1C family serine protease [Thermomonas sp.]MBV2208115.1 S1C family serine protease [Thermomonas sp.]
MKMGLFFVAMPVMWLALASGAGAQELSAQEVFKQVSPSVVVIEVREYPEGKPSRLVASGSGVIVPSRSENGNLVATNCHLTDKSDDGIFLVRHGESSGIGFMKGRDAERDLCLINTLFPDGLGENKGSSIKVGKDGKVIYKKLPTVRVASSQWLEVGDPVYAIGAPQGLELTLSNGLVSGIREYKGTEYIQTTAPISQGSSGGGLFDAQGRLVGITTMYLKDGQNLNFAIPAELIASVPEVGKNNVQPAARTLEPVPQPVEKPASPRSRWVEVGSSDLSTAYVDTQTLQRNGTDVTVWTKFVLDRPKTDKAGDTYDEELRLDAYHCASRQSTTKFFSQRLRGSLVWSHEYKSYEQDRGSIQPGTVGEAIMEAVCK